MIDWAQYFQLVASLLVAALLGGLIGLEREVHGRWAGLRTHTLVAMGAALFVLGMTGIPHESGDISRVIQGITAGLGFIGGGTILKLTDKLEVKGLTTASTLWLAASLGVVSGLKLYPLAITAAFLALGVLTLFRWLEADFSSKHSKTVPWSPPQEERDRPHEGA